MSTSILTAPLVLVPQFFGSVVYDRTSCQYLPFDTAATALLVLLANKSIGELLQETADEESRAAISGFFHRFHGRGFFTIGEKFAGAVLPLPTAGDHLSGPLTLHLELTRRCNLRCRHCFAGNAREDGAVLPTSRLEALFAEMSALGTFRLGLTGGEPLLRPDILDIIDLALAHGLTPCLTTNGLLLTEELAQQLGRRSLAWLNVSLEGASAATHDAVRGDGTFAVAMEKIRLLSRHARFSLAFTLMRSNMQEAEACVRLAHEVGAQAAVFRPLYPVGEACHHPDLFVELRDYLAVLDRLSRLDGQDWSFCSVHPWGPKTQSVNEAVIHTNFGCGAGNLVCSVSADGDVSPCSFLGKNFIAGNLRNHTLADIWHDSEVFITLRELPVNGRCDGCHHYARCGGGCRARALAHCGDIRAADPWCANTIQQVQ